jgi:hypothetical protein
VVGGVMTLTGITLASNLGTFVLYALICSLTVVAFAGGKDFNLFKHGIIPALGVITNMIMVLAIFIIGIRSGGISAQATYLALGVSGGWFILSMIYFVVTSFRKGKAILPSTATVISSPE